MRRRYLSDFGQLTAPGGRHYPCRSFNPRAISTKSNSQSTNTVTSSMAFSSQADMISVSSDIKAPRALFALSFTMRAKFGRSVGLSVSESQMRCKRSANPPDIP